MSLKKNVEPHTKIQFKKKISRCRCTTFKESEEKRKVIAPYRRCFYQKLIYPHQLAMLSFNNGVIMYLAMRTMWLANEIKSHL